MGFQTLFNVRCKKCYENNKPTLGYILTDANWTSYFFYFTHFIDVWAWLWCIRGTIFIVASKKHQLQVKLLYLLVQCQRNIKASNCLIVMLADALVVILYGLEYTIRRVSLSNKFCTSNHNSLAKCFDATGVVHWTSTFGWCTSPKMSKVR